MLAATSHESRMTFASVVGRKGPVDPTTRRLVADLDWLGLRMLVFKLDQESAILVRDSRSQACCSRINAHN